MPIYMKFPGVEGTGTGKYKGWIELQSCQVGVNRHVTNPSGRGTNREGSTPSVSEIVVTKDLDSASTNLYRRAMWGEGVKVTIDFVKDEKATAPYLSLELENTLISNYSVSGHGGVAHSQPMESLSLNFSSIKYSAQPVAPAKDGKAVQDRATWDLATGKGA